MPDISRITILKPARWYAWHDRSPVRLRQEQEAMKSRFPDFTLVRGDDGQLGWVGWLKSNRSNRYKVLIDYPGNFPHEEPRAFLLEPRFTSQHMWKDGHLCLMYPDGSTWQTNTTCATILAIVAAWIFAYENHKAKCRRDDGGPCMDPQCPDWPGKKL
ncbi:MAG: hypothetical protein WCI73_08075 [Phycisphaerae bacterium]